MKTSQTVTTNNLGMVDIGAAKELVAAGAVREVNLIAAGDMWVIALRMLTDLRVIRAQRGNERRFKTADAAIAFCYRELGVSHVTVHLQAYGRRQNRDLALANP